MEEQTAVRQPMRNRYYEPGANRAARVNDLFAAVAPRYDLINDLQSLGLHRGWKRRLIQMAGGQRGDRALDLCCGTGDVAFALADAGFSTIGLDFSGPMLSVAAHRLAKRTARAAAAAGETATQTSVSAGMGRLQFLRGNAQQLPFPDEQFDVVTISYGLRNLTDWEAGLAEMMRVTKKGGRLLVLDFGKPDNRIWRAFYFTYLRGVVPLFGRVFCGDAQTHSYILESLHHYPAQHGVAREMLRLGCSGVGIVNLLGGVMTINHGIRPPAPAPAA